MRHTVTIKQVLAEAVRRKQPMTRSLVELHFPSGGSIRSASYRPQTLRELIEGLTRLEASMRKKRSNRVSAAVAKEPK